MSSLSEVWRTFWAWVRSNPFWVDLAGTIPAILLLLIMNLITGSTFAPLPLAFLTVGLIGPLAIRRTHPALSAAIIYSFGVLVLLTVPWAFIPAAVGVPIALHSVTLHGPRWAYRTALIGSLVGSTWLIVVSLRSGPFYDPVGTVVAALFMLFFAYMFFLTVWALALMRRSRREKIEALVDRAAQLEKERDQQHRIATAAERTRIAREMHDIVAHSLSVIIAQADGGRYVARNDPAAAERVLSTIAETGRDALADMRSLLGVLRPTSTATTPPCPPGQLPDPDHQPTAQTPAVEGPDEDRRPQPAPGDLETLVNQVRASGLRVSYVRMGTPRQLPPGVGLAVYRICQESLTNVLKHAGPDPSVTVLLRWDAATLILDVSDDGRGAAAEGDGAGQGLLGMGERATMFGGTLTSGPRRGGGFRVHLELPIPPLKTNQPPQQHQPAQGQNQ